MAYRRVATLGALAVSFAIAGACSRDEPNETSAVVTHEGEDTAEVQKQRQEHIRDLDERVSKLEGEYGEANQKVTSGARTPTAGLREEVKEDLTNIRQAVDDLESTTPDNWWERHERAMRRTADDVEEDVKRLAGNLPAPSARQAESTGTSGEVVSTAPFTSQRDSFVRDTRARIEAMERALDAVKAKGARETELDDTRARVRKMSEDLDALGKASADDWWDLSRERVADYVARVEDSIERLDDNKPGSRN